MADIWARRWLLAEDVRWPQANYLALAGLGDGRQLLTPRGDGLTLQLTAAPEFQPAAGGWLVAGRGEPLLVEGTRPPECAVPEQVSIRYRFAGGGSKQGTFTHFAGADFRYELPPLVEPVEIMVEGGDDWFGPVVVEPIDRPTLAEMKLIWHAPGTAAVNERVIGAGDEPLLFLPQTRLELQLVANEPLRGAEWVMPAGEVSAPLERLDERTFRFRWTMEQPRSFELRLTAELSGLASRPYFLMVGLLHDREPRLTLRASGVGRRVTPQARIPLAVHAADDFGLAALNLELERTELAGSETQTSSKTLPLESLANEATSGLPATIDRAPELPLAEQSLAPGMAIRLRAAAVDSCPLGAHQGYSRWLGFQIVTPDELFYEILMRQREQRAKFVAALGQAQAQAEALEKLDMLDGVAPLVRVHQIVGRQIRQVAAGLDASLREMTLNDLANPTARQLLADRVVHPLGELANGPFEQLRLQLGRLRGGEAIDPADRAAALQTQQEIVRRMQGILSEMSQWESFVDVINQLRNILKLQNELKTTTEQAQKKQAEQLFDE